MVKYGLSYASLLESIWAVVKAVNSHDEFSIEYPASETAQLKIAYKFENLSEVKFNNCAGAIDDILIWILKPSEEDANEDGCLLNRIRVSVDIATGPIGATDLNAIEGHRAESILVHPNKSSHKGSAIQQGRTIRREFRHHDVIHHYVDQKCVCMFLCFLGACQHLFLLARFGHKTDGHKVFRHVFLKFSMYFFLIGKA
jgi:hypothetical protein